MPDDKRPIIIKRKAAAHGGHHGGAWKVAYADFVTAMMALFIVLWLMSTSQQVKEAVAGYFQDPKGSGKLTGSNVSGTGKGASGKPEPQPAPDDMPALKEAIEKGIENLPDFAKMKDQIVITVTSEGLRIEMMETEKGMFFESGSASPTTTGTELLHMLSAQLTKLPNRILIEGHTDARPYVGRGEYSNWELSADRANRARFLMQSSGLRPEQVAQVRGYADQALRDQAHPNDAANRRISLLVCYREQSKILDVKAAVEASKTPKEPAKKEPAKKEPAKH